MSTVSLYIEHPSFNHIYHLKTENSKTQHNYYHMNNFKWQYYFLTPSVFNVLG